jgi:hypothetical protein
LYAFFEAQKDVEATPKATSDKGVRAINYNLCIGAEDAVDVPFYVNRHPESSSLLEGAPVAMREDPSIYLKPSVYTWGENVTVDRVEKLVTTSLATFMKEQGVVPDMLSIDAQGAEFDILLGCHDMFEGINAFVTEVEFFEIYRNQGLFSDQMQLFSLHGVRLVEIFSQQFCQFCLACASGS